MSRENKSSGKGYIRTDKKFQKTILMANIDKPDISKEKHTKWYSLVLVERSAVKSKHLGGWFHSTTFNQN